MSTKTTIKRIALVAVAALGFGMLSSVPSQAYTSGYSLTVDANDSVSVGDTATATITQTFYASSQHDSITVNAVLQSGADKWTGAGVHLVVADSTTSATTASAANRPTITWGNSTDATNSRSGDGVKANGAYGWNADSATVGSTAADRYVTVKYTAYLYGALAAGTYTVAFNSSSYTAGSAAGAVTSLGSTTWTVTVGAVDTKATSGTLSLRTGAASSTTPFSGTAEGTDSKTTVAKSSTSVAAEFSVWPALKNAAGTASESLTVSVVGDAYITNSGAGAPATHPTSGTTLTLKYGEGVYVWSTGTAGTATITVSTASGLALGTKTVKFAGNVTKLAIATDPIAKTIAAAADPTNKYTASELFRVNATDALGYPKTGLTVSGVAADSSIISAVTCSEKYTGTPAANGVYTCSVTSAAGSKSGQKTTVTIRTVDPAVTSSTSYITTTIDISLGGAAVSEKITFDKSSYAPGEQMIVTITGKDASGNPVYDGAAALTLTSNKAMQGLSSAMATTYTGGVADSQLRATDGTVENAYQVFAPAAEGDFTVSATAYDAAAVAYTASATASVTGASADAIDAANEATDAANAATDAANAAAEAADAATAAAQDAQAAVAELASQVASLIAGIKAQITSLTNLVIKIQKKVKA